jgi:hypothetical protein
MIRASLMLAASTLAAPAFAQNAAPIDASNVRPFVGQLREMGYSPSEITQTGEIPVVQIKLAEDQPLGVTFGGCTELKDCRYVSFTGIFEDVTNPPVAWVAEQNGEFDLIKVWTTDKGKLAYSATAVVQGWSRENFRNWMDLYRDSAATLAQLAIEAKLQDKP